MNASDVDTAINSQFLAYMTEQLPDLNGVYPMPDRKLTGPQSGVVANVVKGWNETHSGTAQVTMQMGIRCIRVLGNARHA